jgi:hypothetical protein
LANNEYFSQPNFKFPTCFQLVDETIQVVAGNQVPFLNGGVTGAAQQALHLARQGRAGSGACRQSR